MTEEELRTFLRDNLSIDVSGPDWRDSTVRISLNLFDSNNKRNEEISYTLLELYDFKRSND